MQGPGLLLFELLNRALQSVLSVDPDTAAEFGQLRGKLFCVELTLPPVTLYLIPEPDGFSLAGEAEGQPDVTLRGSLSAFARLAGKGSASGVLSDGQVTVEGDAEAGQMLQKIISRFDFDWEELIARMIGDLPARKVGNAVRDTTEWASKTADLSRENLADFLTEEKKLVIGQAALRRFEHGVSELRRDSERLLQRVDQLRSRLQQQSG